MHMISTFFQEEEEVWLKNVTNIYFLPDSEKYFLFNNFFQTIQFRFMGCSNTFCLVHTSYVFYTPLIRELLGSESKTGIITRTERRDQENLALISHSPACEFEFISIIIFQTL